MLHCGVHTAPSACTGGTSGGVLETDVQNWCVCFVSPEGCRMIRFCGRLYCGPWEYVGSGDIASPACLGECFPCFGKLPGRFGCAVIDMSHVFLGWRMVYIIMY